MAGATYEGRCHCGQVAVRLETSRAADALQVRACQCEFCRRHAAMTVSDPSGAAQITAVAGGLVRYQFATRTATSLLCAACGVYVGAVLEDGGQCWSTLNVRGLGLEAFAGRTADAVAYEHESPAERIARRRLKWTPTRLAVGEVSVPSSDNL
ncbi:MAG: hypothetical protein R3D31_08875 [Hyphomicrobiaceae bacterium]